MTECRRRVRAEARPSLIASQTTATGSTTAASATTRARTVSSIPSSRRATVRLGAIAIDHADDAKGEYIATWLPQLAPFSIDQRHVPWLLTSVQREQHQLTADKFPERPIIEQNSWRAHYKRSNSRSSRGRGRGPKKGSRDDA